MAATLSAAGGDRWTRYTDCRSTGAAFLAAEAALILAACLLFFTSLPQRWLQRRRRAHDAAATEAAEPGYGDRTKKSSSTAKKRRLKKLPEVRGWPVVGLLPHFAMHGPDAGMLELSRRHGAAPVVSFRIGSKRMLLVSSTEMARAVLREQEGMFLGRPPPPFVAAKLGYREQEIAFQDYGPDYRFRRRLILQHMLNSPRVAMFQSHRESEFSALVRALHYVCGGGGSRAAGGQEQAVTVRPFVRAATVNAVAATGMSQRIFHMPGEDGYPVHPVQQQSEVSPRSGDWEHLGAHFLPTVMTDSPGKSGFDQIVRIVTSTFTIVDLFPSLAAFESLLLRGLNKRLHHIFTDMDAFLQDAVDSRRRDLQIRDEQLVDKNNFRDDSQEPPPPRDVLDILLSFRDADNQPLPDRSVKSQIQLMMLAGVDNVTLVVEWALAELLCHPECLRKVHDEMDRVVGRQRPLQETDLPNLPYLSCVVRETLRLHPLTATLFPRRCTQETEIAGYHVPADTIVLVNAKAIHLDPAVWPDAHIFLPDRFLNWTGSDYMRGLDYRFLPFGSGRRMCPGLHLGSGMLDLALAKLLHSFHVRLPGDLKPQDICMLDAKGAVVWMHQPLTAIFSPRLDCAV